MGVSQFTFPGIFISERSRSKVKESRSSRWTGPRFPCLPTRGPADYAGSDATTPFPSRHTIFVYRVFTVRTPNKVLLLRRFDRVRRFYKNVVTDGTIIFVGYDFFFRCIKWNGFCTGLPRHGSNTRFRIISRSSRRHLLAHLDLTSREQQTVSEKRQIRETHHPDQYKAYMFAHT